MFEVRFACACGGEHVALVSDDDLDWAPLGLGKGRFFNLMTAALDDVAGELGDLAARRISLGEWPWSFYCYPEGRPRPVFPSSFRLVAPGVQGGSFGLAISCPMCASVSVNLVSRPHVDLPFHNDEEVVVVEHVFSADAVSLLERFQDELYSARFDARRLALE